MDYQPEWKASLDEANNELAQFGTEIKIVANGERRSDILIVKNDRDQPVTLAEYIRNSDLADHIEDALALAHILIARDIRKNARKEKLHTYRELTGGAHDGETSLVSKFTDYPLFFLLPNGSIESVREASRGVLSFEDREGVFVVGEEDYEPAMIQADEHEEDA